MNRVMIITINLQCRKMIHNGRSKQGKVGYEHYIINKLGWLGIYSTKGNYKFSQVCLSNFLVSPPSVSEGLIYTQCPSLQ